METRITILNELKDISSTVAGIGSALPYQVPQGYFEGLAAMILQRVKSAQSTASDELETLSPLLNSLSRKLPYEVPQGYFSELSGNVVGGAKAIEYVKGELQSISPLMESLKSKQVYEAPEGYFDGLAGKILDKIKKQQPAKLIQMNPARRVMRYAAAAIVAGALAIGGWFYFNNNTGNISQPLAEIETLSDDTKISEDELSSFLENDTLSVAVNISSVNEDIDESDVKEMLAEVSEDELQQYITTL